MFFKMLFVFTGLFGALASVVVAERNQFDAAAFLMAGAAFFVSLANLRWKE